MAANPIVIASLKSTPDISRLQNMTARMVTVTRQGVSRGPGLLVVPTQKNASLEQIIELHKTLPMTHGPGTYHFEVHDEGSSEKDEWTVRLGADVPEASLMSTPGVTAAGPQASNTPVPEGCIPMGHGYFYNPELGTLTTPQRMVFNWKPGEAMPGQHSGAAAAFASQIPSQAPAPSPWETQSSDRVRVLEEKIRDDARAREAAERARETSELIERMERRATEDRQRFETLIAELTKKPSGPTESELQLRREVEEQRRRNDELQRETSLRNEMQASQTRLETLVRESTANKSDPMLMMLTQVMTSSIAAGAESTKAMQASAQAQATASERHAQIIAERLGGSIMNPLQIVEMIKTAKDTSSNDKINSSMVEMFQNLFGMAKGLVREQAEMYSQSGGPAWLPVAQEGVQALGRVAQMYAATKAREAQQQQQQQRPQFQQPQQQQQRPQQQQQPRPVQQAPAAAPVVAVPVAPAVSANDAERDRIAAQVFGKVAPVDVEREKAAAIVFPPTATPPAAPQAPAPAPVAAAPAPAPAAKKPRKVQVQPAAPPPVPAAPLVPDAVVSSAGVVAAPPAMAFHDAPIEVIREIANHFSDDQFFGPAYSHVVELRAAIENTTPEQVATFVGIARQQLMSMSLPVPPCIEVLEAKHYRVLVERMFPDLDDESYEAIAEAIEAHARPSGQQVAQA